MKMKKKALIRSLEHRVVVLERELEGLRRALYYREQWGQGQVKGSDYTAHKNPYWSLPPNA